MPGSIENKAHPAFPLSLPANFPAREKIKIEGSRITGPDGGVAFIEKGPRADTFSLNHCLKGHNVRLTSAIKPLEEDVALVRRLPENGGGGVLCYGLGLAFYLEELAAGLPEGTPIWVLESRPELAAAALMSRDFSSLLSRPGFKLFIGPFKEKPWGHETPPLQQLWRPATSRHFASEYSCCSNQAAPQIRKQKPGRILIFQNDYYLDRELPAAAESLGLETAVWNFHRGLKGTSENYQALLETIKNFHPDLVLTVNHLGFDSEGIVDDLFARLHLKVASWFVDSPAFILEGAKPGPETVAFSWDKDYLDLLKDKGFNQVHYLPLATDERFFKPQPAGGVIDQALAFVGDSLSHASGKYLGKLGLKPGENSEVELLARADQAAEKFLFDGSLLPSHNELRDIIEKFELAEGSDAEPDLAALITWRASRLWRLKVLSALPQDQLTVAGDENWRALLGLSPGNLRPPLDYYSELSSFYCRSRVNINITSAQMKTGLNQRIFDVPASGALLLTDRREQLFEHFEPETEVLTYQSPEEAAERSAWFLKHPEAGQKVSRAAYRRVRACHLYCHRLKKIWDLTGGGNG